MRRAQTVHARRSWPRRRLRVILAIATAAFGVQLAVGVAGADAHWWWPWKWQRSGAAVYIYVWDYSGSAAANAARLDIYYRPHPIYLPTVNYHTDISIYSAYEPSANYCGLAEIINWHWWFGYWIDHAHEHNNTACGDGGPGTWTQGVYCQETAHTLGLDHADVGDCMGLSYFAGSNGRYCFDWTGCNGNWGHESADLYDMYRY
jgi:hypothetical protein